MNRKKILMVAGVFYPEPIVSANLLTQLATELAKRYDVMVMRPKPTRPKGFKMPIYNYSQFPFKVVEIDSYICAESSLFGRYKETISMGKICADYIDKHHYEIDFVFNDAWHLWGVNMVAKVACRYGIPYITPVQDIYPESLASKLPKIKLLQWLVMKLLGPIDRYTLVHAAKIHTISDKMVEQLSVTRCLPKKKFVVVRNWQNEDEFIAFTEAKATLNEDLNCCAPFTFMYLGNVGPLAGIEVLFDALKIAHLSNARLVVAGSGSAKEALIDKAKRYTNCNIEFWDVPAGMVPSIQDKADVLCLPVKKGFAISSIPSKLPAYMFSAKPILASVDKESDTAECVINAKAGWVALPEDANDVARCMKMAYILSEKQLQEMGKRGFKYSMQYFSRKVNLPILVNTCVEVIEEYNKRNNNLCKQ